MCQSRARKQVAISVVSAVLLSVGAAMPARAQSNVEVNAGIQFDFVNPGARSLALGSAFTAIADDATAAFSNPAGLREISRREFSFETRVRRYNTPFTARGHAFGAPTGVGIDTVEGLQDGFSKETLGSISFASFVYPTTKWAFAAYYHELARFKTHVETDGAFVGSGNGLTRIFPVIGDLDLSVRDGGGSVSYRITDQVSVGAGLAMYKMHNESLATRYRPIGGAQTAARNLNDPAGTQQQSGDEWGFGVNAGVLFKPSNSVQIGGTFRKGVDFDVQVTTRVTGISTPLVDDTATFRVPDVYSLGVMVRPVEPLRIGLDYSHVRYSQTTKGFVDVLLSPGASSASDYTVENGNEIHLGAEYFFASAKVPVAVRGGLWYDPAHSLVFDGPAQTVQALFRERDSQVHWTGGGGVVVKRVEFNGGVDIADTSKTVSLSMVVRF
jgi:long-chain fatty acid transport protein